MKIGSSNSDSWDWRELAPLSDLWYDAAKAVSSEIAKDRHPPTFEAAQTILHSIPDS
jgi:hypothetical protein